MTNEELRDYLTGRRACQLAMDWLGDRDLETTWRECERADWLLWLVGPRIPRTDLVWLACQCARTALVYVPEGEDRPRLCVETAERWARGEASIVEVRAAARAVREAHAEARWPVRSQVISAVLLSVRAASATGAAWTAVEVVWAANRSADRVDRVAAVALAHTTMCAIIRAKYPVCPDLRKGGV